MVLNYIWIGFFLIALVVAIIKTFNGDMQVFSAIVNSTFDMAEIAFEISLGLTGILCLWLGIMKIGEKGGAVNGLSKIVGPFFNRLFPDVPQDHPARGAMLMNFSANMLGLDNAATPMGLKAMEELQKLNDKKDTASNAMIMFLVLNTSGLTLIPVAVMNYRSQFGAENPSDIFIPILIATFAASLIGLITISIYQKINLLDPVILAYLGGLSAIVGGLIFYFNSLTPEQLTTQSTVISNVILYGLICLFIILGIRKKVNIYEAFIEGAKGGFDIAIKIIPYLVAILVSIGVFRASGAMDYLIMGFEWFFSLFMTDTSFVNGIPTALMKPLSGSGARGMMLDSFQNFGVDSFEARLNATLQGATDTTFYIIAVYFGSVGIRKTRYAVKAGLIADLGGVIAAIIIATMFFQDNTVSLNPTQMSVAFTENWTNGNSEENENFMSESCVVYDQAFDTIHDNRQSILDNFFLEYPQSKTETVKQIAEQTSSNPVDITITKVINAEGNKSSYEFVFKKRKIVAIKYLGNF